MNNLPILIRALFDRRTPMMAKMAVVFAALYGVSPIDLLPDFLPLVGQADDLTLIIIVFLFFLRMTKKVRSDMSSNVIDARVVP